MNAQEKIWFSDLTKKRLNTINVLRDDGFIDVVVSHIIDTYRESAHFIYELLQNADDVKATKARFLLKSDGILFAHNGVTNFSISNPLTERDPETIPGHINAITTFSLSSKKEDIENKIGKFGIGFKSVFQYTDTPHIYNNPYCFKIENFMVPVEIDMASELIKEGETTVFWLPFNKTDKAPADAYKEISKKLRTLNNPLLFLNAISEVCINDQDYTQTFTRVIELNIPSVIPDISIKKVTLNSDVILRFDDIVAVEDIKGNSHNLSISIGFVLEKKSISSNDKYTHYFQYAWCFFPTQQPTGLNYIINAPFILTPNREALKEGRKENAQLIKGLGNLVDKAIQCLKITGFINEDFFTTLPVPAKLPVDFRTIGEKIITKLKMGEFIPARDGSHISVSDAFVCTESLLAELLSYNNGLPLKRITNRSNAKIVFPERKLFSDANLFVFIYQNLSGAQSDLTAAWLGARYIETFLDDMPEEFDILFFKYLSERSNVILGKGQPLWLKPFVPVEKGEGNFMVVSPRNKANEPQVFVGGAKLANRYVVVDYLANDPETKDFLFNTLNFRIPNEFDDFYTSLDKYEREDHSVPFEEAVKDFYQALQLYREVSANESSKLLKRLKELKFIIVYKEKGEYKYTNPSKWVTYLPGRQLIDYFQNSDTDFNWFASEKYEKESEDHEKYHTFLRELHIQEIPYYWAENTDGKKNVLHKIQDFIPDISLEGSIYLVDILFGRNAELKNELAFLKTTAWLYDKNGTKRKPAEVFLGDLHANYSINAGIIHVRLGGITEIKIDKYANLTEDEKEILKLIAPNLDELSVDEISMAIAELLRSKQKRKKTNENASGGKTGSGPDNTTPEGVIDAWLKDPLEKNKKKNDEETLNGSIIPTIPNSSDFWQDESDEINDADNPGGFISAPTIGNLYIQDKETKKKKQLEKEIERESKRNKLIELASQFEPYSFGWFKTLLELEDNFTSEDRVKRNPVRVVFNQAALDHEGILILSDTVYIPPTIEEIGELSIHLFFEDQKRTIVGEVVSPKKQTLHVKLNNNNILNGIDVTKISQAVVEASSPDFILEKLKIAFSRLNFEDTDNLKSPHILPANLNFIFGPPGTGKTTYLSWLIGGKNNAPLVFAGKPVNPLMEQESKRVLVLTPTNKAADVLVQRVLNNYQKAHDYPQWLIRFGQSEALESEPIFVGDRKLKSWVYDKCTMVTTIARFPYDYFRIERDDIFDDWSMKDFSWDVIIFDEASMIHQSAILYVIFYAKVINPAIEFYIGGDPFQIPPIIQFEFPFWSYLPELAFDNEGMPIIDESGKQVTWRQDGGSIYSFVGLTKDDSFANPVTEPHQFPIHNLNKQFRSIVPIGALFSHYRYGGLLQHNRTDEAIALNKELEEKQITINGLPVKPLTIIKFPVKKYEGVYRVRTINGSPYQLYSSIFTVELIKYIQQNAQLIQGQVYRIGIISPYAIQSNLISNLISKIVQGPIEIATGTVHSFQGDECNLVIVVLNPPRNISRSVRTFLNKKNILNVAISRAMDKMIILSPYDPDNEINVKDLHQIQWIIKLAGTKPECRDHVQGYKSVEIEKTLWGSDRFIEDLTFSTTHQNVNIYTRPAKKYEVRQDENAIDVQVRNE